MFLAPEIFFGVRPQILDRHYTIPPITDHRAKFLPGRPTHLGDFASGKKHQGKNLSPLRKLSLSGGLKKPVASACYDKQHVCTYLQPFHAIHELIAIK